MSQAQKQLLIGGKGSLDLDGKALKPIRWIGTQRSAFTHRKDNQRNKIRALIGRLKQARERHEEVRKERAAIKEAQRVAATS